MQTKDVSAELELAMQKLHEQGKLPTVALVKAHLSSCVPMPAIIAAIKSWKGNKQIPKIEIAEKTDSNYEERVIKLEQQVAELTARLNTLEGK